MQGHNVYAVVVNAYFTINKSAATA